MIIDYDVPFYGNLPDDTHCAQATLRSVRRYFEPDRNFGWDELDACTGKTGVFTTWRMTGLLWMQQEGYDVHIIENLDYGALADYGIAYLNEFYGPEMAQWHAETSDMLAARATAREFALSATIQRRQPTQSDIEAFLNLGFLVQVTVNARRLNDATGYLGHAVLIKGYDGNSFILHDPGLPPRPNRIISRDEFEAAWSDPNPDVKHLAAFRKAAV